MPRKAASAARYRRLLPGRPTVHNGPDPRTGCAHTAVELPSEAPNRNGRLDELPGGIAVSRPPGSPAPVPPHPTARETDSARVSQLLAARRTAEALSPLTAHEREVLSTMAEGHTNAAIADMLGISRRAVEKHTAAIFDKLSLPRTDAQNRRVLAVLHYLDRLG
ncbi:LuxR C-terminal-related transcriptional regulator [Streptomyces sp. NPDC001828]|uniref:LuxR C-terminal-related transcriptional regulator n=1 Tax=Streptomyces sp. NPDC001828 TaxID=3364615 RepID=UPI00369D203A